MLAARNALAAEDRRRASLRIHRRIVGHPAFDRARAVMAYCSFASELDTSPLLAEIVARGKTLVLPRVDRQRQRLALFVVRDLQHDLVADKWGIGEPRPEACTPAQLAQLDVMVVPGIAFDAAGRRLGYGKAYYDRLLHLCRREGASLFIIAGAFEAQIVDRVPTEAHDVPVPWIATEVRMIECTTQDAEPWSV